VRVPWNDPAHIQKALDAGAYGIVCPMINNRAEAEKFVGSCRYAPLGYRSSGPIRAALYGGADYHAKANDIVVALGMIETQEALDNLDAIAATPGLDGLFVGPNDLSISLGFGLGADLKTPKIDTALKAVIAAAKANGLVPGAFGGSPELCRQYVERGFRFIAAATDVNMLAAGAKAMQP